MDEARAVLSHIAQGNGTQMPEGELKRPGTSGDKSLGLTSLLSGPVIRKRVVVLFAIW
jgi:hypothetical protein